ncbi:MAG: hypothetical protein A3J97_04345 [Spirochaetes bacterium RIFOXYC1_FULL_54_7]|nr:MAG: hypothetical protein A3J97_04345 [Spirochaetes bacterium RIFOXYC1_FULL_54_7]
MTKIPTLKEMVYAAGKPERLVWIILSILIVVSLVASPLFSGLDNLRNVFLIQPVGLGLAALGQTFIVLAGGIDLSVGSVISLLTSLAAGIFQKYPLMHPLLMVAIMLGLGAAIGAVNGIIVARLRVTPFMATLAMMLIYQGLALFYAKRTIGGIPRSFRFIAEGSVLGVPMSIVLFGFIIALCHIVLVRHRFGAKVLAVGSDPNVSALSGIDVGRTRFLSYLFGGMLFSCAAIFLAARMGGGGPKVGVGYDLDSITAIVIGGVSLSGGTGNVLGAFGGVLIISVFYNLMNLLSLNSFLQILLKGLILIVAVAFTSCKKQG